MRALVMTLVSALALLAGACGGGGDDETAESLRDGVYEYTLTRDYLLEHGIPSGQAESESGAHETTLDAGEFVDRWRTEAGTTGACSGTYDEDGNTITFRWTSGCFGDWRMSYAVSGDQVSWSGVKALPPYDSDEQQSVAEVFNGVPWTRTGDVPEEGEE